MKEKVEFINFYLLRPVVVLKVEFKDSIQREQFIEHTFQKMRQPMLKMPFDPLNPIAGSILKDLLGDGS